MSKQVDAAATQYLRGMHDGAMRERRRVRRDTKHVRDWLRNLSAYGDDGAMRNQAQRFLSQLDDATRSRGKGRK